MIVVNILFYFYVPWLVKGVVEEMTSTKPFVLLLHNKRKNSPTQRNVTNIVICASYSTHMGFPQQSRVAMLAYEMKTWWLSGGVKTQDQSIAQLPYYLFFQAPT
jgi:hypothetical protein